MLQMQVCVLGMTHPTGYPSYLMSSHLFTYLPFGDCAYRANLASAAYAALAVLAAFASGCLLGRRVAAAAAAALAFGVGVTLWSQAVIAEVYTLNALLITLTLLTLLLWRERRRDRYLLLCAFLVGLSLTDHLTSGLLLPASLLFVALVDRRRLANVRLILGSAGLFLVGLMPYLYLPVRSAMDPPFEANNPTNIERFWYVISGGNLRGGFFAFGTAELPGRLAFYWGHLLDNLHWGLLVMAVVGFAALLVWDRPAAGLLGFLFFGWVFYSIENDIPDIEVYFIPTYLVLVLAAAVGFGLLLTEAEHPAGQVPTGPQESGPGRCSRSRWSSRRCQASRTLTLGTTGAVTTGGGRSSRTWWRTPSRTPPSFTTGTTCGTWYCRERRQDLTLVDPFWHNRDVGYADIVWPDDLDLTATDRRYGTNDFSGVIATKKAAKKGPVYVIEQEDVNFDGLHEAGFRTVHVHGALYELRRETTPPTE